MTGKKGPRPCETVSSPTAFLLVVSWVSQAWPSSASSKLGAALGPATVLPPPLSCQVTVTPVLSVEVPPGKWKQLQY